MPGRFKISVFTTGWFVYISPSAVGSLLLLNVFAYIKFANLVFGFVKGELRGALSTALSGAFLGGTVGEPLISHSSHVP